MTLWDLLLAMNLVMPIAGAMSGAHELQTEWPGYCIAIVTGLALGAISVWILWTVGRLALRSTQADDTRSPWKLRLLYWAAFVWPFVTLFGSGWLLSAVLEILWPAYQARPRLLGNEECPH